MKGKKGGVGVPFKLIFLGDTKQFHKFSDSSVTILPKAMAAGSEMPPPARTLDPDEVSRRDPLLNFRTIPSQLSYSNYPNQRTKATI